MRRIILVLLGVFCASLMGCLTIMHHAFDIPANYTFVVGNWTIDQLDFYWGEYAKRDKNRDWEYLPEMRIKFQSQPEANNYPFFNNDIVVDSLIIESVDGGFKTQARFERTYGGIDDMFDGAHDSIYVAIYPLPKAAYKLVQERRGYDVSDTLYVRLHTSQEQDYGPDPLEKKYKRILIIRSIDEMQAHTSPGTKATKFIHFEGVTIPRHVKAIKLGFTAKIVNHFSSRVIETKHFEKILHRKDYRTKTFGY